ncbi:MAG: DUF5818 domain-containing protein [Terriglobales bacterium]
MQQPRPAPQPLPDPPEQQPALEQPGQSANPQTQQQPAAQTFIGTITKDDSKYVLEESSGTTYQLDNQDKAKQYEGKQVRIVGNLDANSNKLHIARIQETFLELASPRNGRLTVRTRSCNYVGGIGEMMQATLSGI